MNRLNQQGRVFGLDLMRCAAIGLVLLCHVLLVMRYWLPSSLGYSVMAGYFGVEIFFVLSGFLIGGILIRDFSTGVTAGKLSQFWGRRWLRTLPLYYLFLIINLWLNTAWGGPTTGWWRHVFFVQNFSSPPSSPFFIEAWSLSIEEWFYLLTPAAIYLLAKAGLPLKRAVLVAGIVGLIGATLWRMHVVLTANPDSLSGVRPVVTLRLDACMFGVLAAWWKHYAPASWSRWSAAKLVVGVLCLLAAVWIFRFLSLRSSFAGRTHLYTLTPLGAALCLPALTHLRHSGSKFGIAVTSLSKWSYAMYLVNFPIFAWLAREAGEGLVEPVTAGVAAATALLLTVVASAALHYLYEMPILRWRDRHLGAAHADGKRTAQIEEVATWRAGAPSPP